MPRYQTRTCPLGSDCHWPGSQGSPGDCICHRLSQGWCLEQNQSVFAASHKGEAPTASTCLGAPVPCPHTHTPTHFFALQASSHLTQPADRRKVLCCAPGQGTSSSGGWLRVLQAVRALSDGEGEAQAPAAPPYPTPLLSEERSPAPLVPPRAQHRWLETP